MPFQLTNLRALPARSFLGTGLFALMVTFSASVPTLANNLQRPERGNEPTEVAFDRIVEENRRSDTIQWHRHGVTPGGRHKGEPLKTDSSRAIALLNGTELEREFDLKTGEMLIANVFHNHENWVAKVPADAVESMDFVLARFLPGTGHGMNRYNLKKPLQLVARIVDDGPNTKIERVKTPVLLNEVFFSAEYIVPEGGNENYNAIRGLQNLYANADRLVSAQERLANHFVTGNPQQYWPYNYTSEEANLALKEAVVNSHIIGYSRMYNTAFYNCIRCAIANPARANGYIKRGDSFSRQALGVLHLVGAQLTFIPEFSTENVLIARGMRDLEFSGKKSFLETDPRLAAIYKKERKARVKWLASQKIDAKWEAQLLKSFGPEFVAEIEVARAQNTTRRLQTTVEGRGQRVALKCELLFP